MIIYKLAHCLQTLSRSHLLIYAYSLGCRLKYSVADWYCHADLETSEGDVLNVALSASYLFKLAAIVETGSKDETEDCMGNALAYIRSRNNVSKTSRTTSIVVGSAAPRA